MNCQECELLLAQGEIDAAAQMHLRDCPECRALVEAFDANAAVLDSLRGEELPRIEVKIPRRRIYGYAAALAAVAATLIFAMQLPRPHPPPPAVTAPTPPAGQVQKPQPLKIKMLTADPDVVIYWIVD